MLKKNIDIAVSNTFIKKWEYEPYLSLAEEYGYKPIVIECHADFGNIHEIPLDTLKNMKLRYEPYRQ